MTNNMNVCGHKVKKLVFKDGRSLEKIVALVQDDLALIDEPKLSFSLSGLSKLFKGEQPKWNAEIILGSLARVLRCSVNDFAESEAKAS